MCHKCAKLKMFKTALSGVSQQSSCQGVCQSVLCVSECCTSQSRPDQAQRSCPVLSSLPQPSPADSSQARAQEACPAAQRPRESAYCSGSFPEKLQGPGALTVPRDVPGGTHGHIHLQPIGTVPRLKNYIFTVFENTWKNSKLNILFLLFDI